MNPCNDCISKNICGNPNVTGCISYTKRDEKFLPINCYVCNASGWIAGNGHRHTSKCKRCNGAGTIDYHSLTNEDFLRTATTKQLAHFFAERFGGSADRYNNIYDTMLEWLKQPHTTKE